MKNDCLENSIGISTFCYVEKKKRKNFYSYNSNAIIFTFTFNSFENFIFPLVYIFTIKKKESAIIGFSSWNNENQWEIHNSLKSQLEIRFWIGVKQLHRALTDWTLLRIQRGICSMKYIFAFRLILGSAFQFDSVIVQRGIHFTWNIIYFYLFSCFYRRGITMEKNVNKHSLLLNKEYRTIFINVYDSHHSSPYEIAHKINLSEYSFLVN